MYRRLSRLHVLTPALALALIAGFLATPLGLAHIGSAALDSCDAIVSGQDPGTARLAPGAGADGHQHCFTCHWFQSLRSSFVATGVIVHDAGETSPVDPGTPIVPVARLDATVGARAPPA